MTLNLLITGILIFAAWKGWCKGLVMAVFSFLAIIAGMFLAFRFSAATAGYLMEHTEWKGPWMPAVAFCLVMAVVVLIVNILGKLVENLLAMTALGLMNKLAGAFIYVILYGIILGIALFYATHAGWISSGTEGLPGFLAGAGDKILQKLGEWMPFIKNSMNSILSYLHHEKQA